MNYSWYFLICYQISYNFWQFCFFLYFEFVPNKISWFHVILFYWWIKVAVGVTMFVLEILFLSFISVIRFRSRWFVMLIIVAILILVYIDNFDGKMDFYFIRIDEWFYNYFKCEDVSNILMPSLKNMVTDDFAIYFKFQRCKIFCCKYKKIMKKKTNKKK